MSSENTDRHATGSSGSQAGLTDLDYDGHTLAQPPDDRLNESHITHDEFFECDVADKLWVDGSEYIVVNRPPALIAPSPLEVIGKHGKQGQLIAGTIQDKSADGVTWLSNIQDKEQRDLSRSDIEWSYDRVYKTGEGAWEELHSWVPDSDHRFCPACSCGRAGEPIRIEQQAGKFVEIRRCTDTDCQQIYRFVRDRPAGEPATIITNDYKSDSLSIETIDGLFRCEEQDDFKFPVETNKGRDNGFFSAKDITRRLNPKMTTEEVASALMSEEDTDSSDILELIETRLAVQSRTADGDSLRPACSLGEVYEDYVSNRLIPYTDSIVEAVNDASFESVFRTLVFLRRVIPDKPVHPGNDPEPTGFDIDPEDAVKLAEKAIESESTPDTVSIPDDISNALREAFDADWTGEDVVTHPVFKELLNDHTKTGIFGVVDVDSNRSGKQTVTWKDEGGHKKMLRETFTEMHEPRTDWRSFRYNLNRHDLSEFLP